MDCKKEENKVDCSCTYMSCSKRGLCCDCVASHRAQNELPGCYFSAAGERTYDRSIENFIRLFKEGK